MFKILPLGHEFYIEFSSLAKIVYTFAHVNVDNAARAYDMALVPFNGGTKASFLDQDSMTQYSMTLILHESFTNANDEGPWIIAFSKLSSRRCCLLKALRGPNIWKYVLILRP